MAKYGSSQINVTSTTNQATVNKTNLEENHTEAKRISNRGNSNEIESSKQNNTKEIHLVLSTNLLTNKTSSNIRQDRHSYTRRHRHHKRTTVRKETSPTTRKRSTVHKPVIILGDELDAHALDLLRRIEIEEAIERNLTAAAEVNRTAQYKFFNLFRKAFRNVKLKLSNYLQRNSTKYLFRSIRTSETNCPVTKKRNRTHDPTNLKRTTKYSKRFLRLLQRRRPDLWEILRKTTTPSGTTMTPLNKYILPSIDAEGNVKWRTYTVTRSRFQRFIDVIARHMLRDDKRDIVPHEELFGFITDVFHVIRPTYPSFPPWMFTFADNTHMIFLRRHGRKKIYTPKRDAKRQKTTTEPSTTLSKWRRIATLIVNYFWTARTSTIVWTRPSDSTVFNIKHYLHTEPRRRQRLTITNPTTVWTTPDHEL
ncbi:hypothetical protein M8J76_016793 [Diaphorina citri]|nr:hypothetical protein M8J75_009924 [Diaphorina citri]KAI5714423.1 hypothetical protein M8J76_016793 [Diaphorina citri]